MRLRALAAAALCLFGFTGCSSGSGHSTVITLRALDRLTQGSHVPGGTKLCANLIGTPAQVAAALSFPKVRLRSPEALGGMASPPPNVIPTTWNLDCVYHYASGTPQAYFQFVVGHAQNLQRVLPPVAAIGKNYRWSEGRAVLFVGNAAAAVYSNAVHPATTPMNELQLSKHVDAYLRTVLSRLGAG